MKMDTPSDLPSLPTPRPSAPFGCRVVCVRPHTSGGWVREDGLEVRRGARVLLMLDTQPSRHVLIICIHAKNIFFSLTFAPLLRTLISLTRLVSPPCNTLLSSPPLHSLHHPPPTTPPPASACSAPFRRTFRTLAAVALMLLHKNVRAVLMAACECEAH